MPTPSLASLLQQRDQIREQLTAVGQLRPGSLVERYRRCGKPSCHCAREGSQGHGPQFSLTRPVRGKTVTRIIPKGPAVERTREQIAEHRRFRKLVSEFVALSEQICDVELKQERNAEAGEDKKNVLAEELAKEAGRDIEALLGRQAFEDLDLEALETAVRQQVLALAGRFLQQQLNADTSDYSGPSRPCRTCEAEARYAGRRVKSFCTSLGRLQLERAYYHCSACEHGWFPRDRDWGIENRACSPAVMRMIATVGAMVSFQEGSQLLAELAATAVDPKQVERIAEALGKEIAADEKQDREAIGADLLPPTLYLGIDGTGVPMRPAEVAGLAGKQPDGSAKTREGKLCIVWSAESRDSQNRPVRDPGSVSYTAAIESAATQDTDKTPAEFTQRVLREADRRRFTEADRQVVIGDGAPWIWKIAQELFPRAIQIVDKFHVKQHLSQLAKSLYGAQSEQACAWAERRHAELDAGRFDELLRAVRRHADRSDDARKCFQYLHRNRARMRYAQFEAEGLCTGSGVVEAGCKVVVGTRLKRAGMRWTVAGANAIIALRRSKLSGRFQDFRERRVDLRKAA